MAILEGVFQFRSLFFLMTSLGSIPHGDVVKVLGINARTLHRQKASPRNPMAPNLASQAWVIAETVATASEVLGSLARAEQWLSDPAIGLGCQRPIELLRTTEGAKVVNDLLTRLEFGVYS
ncbi:antitoxin Xre/MbcA/ParS toxin-binding domain-containing protein [Caldimonas sp. KR1-144]|uniref:antitoxin Xre/MbcA/ParS toxin-binding domain-containing protein n=1 Tax=Caldimonas sp. KR1-144 TaxID=3400911 RepID=UPI003BFECD7F